MMDVLNDVNYEDKDFENSILTFYKLYSVKEYFRGGFAVSFLSNLNTYETKKKSKL